MTCCRSPALCAARVAPAGLALCSANSAPEASHMTNAVFDEASCCETEGRQGYDPALQANRAKADYDVKSGEASGRPGSIIKVRPLEGGGPSGAHSTAFR